MSHMTCAGAAAVRVHPCLLGFVEQLSGGRGVRGDWVIDIAEPRADKSEQRR